MTMPSMASVLCLLGLTVTCSLAASDTTSWKTMDEKIEEITGTVEKLGKQMETMNDKIEDLEKLAEEEDSSEEHGRRPHPWKKFKESNDSDENAHPSQRRGGWGRGWRKDKPKSSEEGADSSEENNEDDSSEEDGTKRRDPPPRRFHPKWARRGGVTFEEEGGDISNKTRGFSFKDLFRTLNKFRRGMGQGRGKGWQERGHKGGGPRDEMGQSRSPGPQERGPGGGGGPRDERGPGPQERGPRGGGWGGRHRNRWPMRSRDEGREQDGRDKSQGYNFMDMFWRG